MLDFLKVLYSFFLIVAIVITFRVDKKLQGKIELDRRVPGETTPEDQDPDDPRPLLVLLGSLLLVLGCALPFAFLNMASPIFGRLLLVGAATYALLLSRWRLYKRVRFPAAIALSMVLFALVYQLIVRAEDPGLAYKFRDYRSQLVPFVLPCVILCSGVLTLFVAAGRRAPVTRREDLPEFTKSFGERWKQQQ